VSRRPGLKQIALVLAAVAAYELARRLIHPDRAVAVRHAHDVLALERVLHVAWEAPLQRIVLHAPQLVTALDLVYLGAHFAVTGLFFLWLYRRDRVAYVRFRDGFVAATALALFVHWRFPVAPPRLAGVGLTDTVRGFLGVDVGSPGHAAVTDPLAAMPSLHAGWAVGVGVGLYLYAHSRLALAYPVVVVLATVVTGNHFLLDAAAGVAVMAAGFWLADTLRGLHGATLAPRRGVEQPGSSPGS
jgi:hypothetical protein